MKLEFMGGNVEIYRWYNRKLVLSVLRKIIIRFVWFVFLNGVSGRSFRFFFLFSSFAKCEFIEKFFFGKKGIFQHFFNSFRRDSYESLIWHSASINIYRKKTFSSDFLFAEIPFFCLGNSHQRNTKIQFSFVFIQIETSLIMYIHAWSLVRPNISVVFPIDERRHLIKLVKLCEFRIRKLSIFNVF